MEQDGLIAINPKVLKGQLQKFKPVINNIWNSVKEFKEYIDDDEDSYAKLVQNFKIQLRELQKFILTSTIFLRIYNEEDKFK